MITQNLDKNNSGFTLTELLITMLIMVIALFALSALKNQSLKSTIAAQRVTEATACAEQRIEELINQGYSSITSGNGNCPDSRYTWTARVDDEETVDDLKIIEVDVEWSGGIITLKTLLSK